MGNKASDRIFLFLNTDDFWRDYNDMVFKEINFVREPQEAEYGTVAVFEDLYGKKGYLLKLNADHPISKRMK